jgi:hypothetical protein
MVEPDKEAQEKGEPRQVQDARLAGKRQYLESRVLHDVMLLFQKRL